MKTKTNNAMGGGAKASKKLMAAIAVLAVAFVVLAAVPTVADDSSAVAPEAPTKTVKASEFFGDSPVSLTENITVTVDKAIKKNVKITADEARVIYVVIPANFTDNSGKPIDGDTSGIKFEVGPNVTLVVDEKRAVDLNGKNTFRNVNLSIEGSTVYFEQAANGKGQFFWSGSIAMTGGKLIMHCNGLSPATLSLEKAQINWESVADTSNEAINGYPSLTVGTKATVDKDSSITIANGARMQMEKSSSATFELSGSFSGEYHIFNTTDGNLTIKDGGEFDGKILVRNYPEGSETTPKTFCYVEAKLTGDGDGAKITMGDSKSSYNMSISGTIDGEADSIKQLPVEGTGMTVDKANVKNISVLSGKIFTVNGNLSIESATIGGNGTLAVGAAGELTADEDSKVKVSSIKNAGRIVDNTEAGIAQTITGVAVLTDGVIKKDITISKDAMLIIPEGMDVTFAENAKITNNGSLYVFGTLTGTSTNVTGNVYAYDSKDVKLPAGSDAGTAIKVATFADPSVTSYADAEKFLSSGVKKVTVTGDMIFDKELTVEEGQTLVTAALTVNEGGVLKNEGTVIVGGELTLDAKASIINDGEFTIKTSSDIIGSFENNKTLNIDGDSAVTVTIGSYEDEVSSKTEFENNGTITLGVVATGGHSFAVAEGCTFINNGVIDSLDKDAAITGAGTFENGAEGDVGVAVNTAKVTGVTKTLTVSDDMTQKNTYMSFQTLQILAGSSLNLTKVADITVNGKFIIDGDLTIYGKLTIGAANADAKSAEIVVNGKITVAEGGQLVIGNTIVNGDNTAYGAGKLSVADTGSVTVDKGGKLTLIDGKTDIKGDLTMAAGSELAAPSHKENNVDVSVVLAVSGTANLNGYIDSTVIVENKGTVTVDNGANEARTGADGGVLGIFMAADKATVVLKSFLFETEDTLIGVLDGGMTVYENAKDETKNAVIPLENCDAIAIGFDKAADATIANEKTKAVKGDLTFVQSASYKTVTVKDDDGKDASEKALTYSIDVSGAISGAFTYDSSVSSSENFKVPGRVTFDIQSAGVQYFQNDAKKAQYTGGVAISGELAIDEYVDTTVSAQNGGVLKVSGTVKNNASGAQKIVVDKTGTVTVTGEIVSSNQIDVSSKGKVNAVYYTTTIGTGKDKVVTHYYTTLDKAIAGVQIEGNTADKIVKIIGTVTLTEDVTLPAAVKMQFFDKDSFLYIGTSDERAKLTAEAEITANEQIEVKGTLTFTDKTKDNTKKTVSDVMYESADANGFRTYTNIYTAIEDAGKSSEATEIKVTKETGKVELDRNLTIPSNVTLVVGDDAHNAGLLLKDGVTLTVDGTLKTSQDILAESRFATTALDVDAAGTASAYKSSAVVVNGMLMFSDDVAAPVYGDGTTGTPAAVPAEKNLTASAPVYGAYYAIEGWNVVSNVDAALKETKITSSAVTIYGPVVGSDVTVTPNDDFKTVVVSNVSVNGYGANASQVATSLTVTSMTLAKDAVLKAVGKFTGSVVVGDAAVTAAKVTGLVATNSDDALVVAGTVTAAKGASFEVSKGTVVLGEVKEGDNTVVFGYTGGYTDSGKSKQNYMTIAAGATAKADSTGIIIDYITVDGTLEVPANEKVEVTGTITVNGTVAVAKATDSSAAGIFEAYDLYIGMVANDYTAASAAVTGPVTVNDMAIVKADATLEQSMSKYKSTQFYNNGALWFTAYAKGDSKTVIVSKAPIENAILKGWATKEGGDVKYEADEAIAIGAYSKLYSVVETEIYNVIIKADKGISDIYIKTGSQETKLVYTQVYDAATKSYYLAYTATVAAGTYTVEYKLENGWSGDAKLTGSGVSGMTFQAAGTPDDGKNIDIVLQLTGIEKSGYVEPSEPSDDKDDGMTITDYLLIVLVVLIVILAVIVAMRLMRS